MQKWWIIFSLLTLLGLLSCSSKETSNPYKETHIISVAPDYEIVANDKSRLTKDQVDKMSEEVLKARFSQLQNEVLSLTPGQKKEFDLISDRLKELSTLD